MSPTLSTSMPSCLKTPMLFLSTSALPARLPSCFMPIKSERTDTPASFAASNSEWTDLGSMWNLDDRPEICFAICMFFSIEAVTLSKAIFATAAAANIPANLVAVMLPNSPTIFFR